MRRKKIPPTARTSRKPFTAPTYIHSAKSNEGSPSREDREFAAIAKLIDPMAPAWLMAHLRRWSASVLLDRVVEYQQPTRAEMRKILAQVIKATGLLQRAVEQTSVREFLDEAAATPIHLAPMQAILKELRIRAELADRSPQLVDKEGKTKAGRGAALPKKGVSAQAFCALVITETWNACHGKYPSPTNRHAQAAIDRYWRLAGGDPHPIGNNPLTAWRHHIKEAKAASLQCERDEIRRHVLIARQDS